MHYRPPYWQVDPPLWIGPWAQESIKTGLFYLRMNVVTPRDPP